MDNEERRGKWERRYVEDGNPFFGGQKIYKDFLKFQSIQKMKKVIKKKKFSRKMKMMIILLKIKKKIKK